MRVIKVEYVVNGTVVKETLEAISATVSMQRSGRTTVTLYGDGDKKLRAISYRRAERVETIY